MTRKKATQAILAQNNYSGTYDLFVKICRQQFGIQVVRELQFHHRRKWRFDYALPAYKIAIEVEGGVWTGGRHTRAQGFLGDMDKYNTATLMGWRIFRTTPDRLLSTSTLNLIKVAIGAAPFPENNAENTEKCTKKEPKQQK